MLQWEDDAQEKVTFTNKDDKNEGVLATLWVEPSAFECGLTLEDLAHLQFDMNQSETVQSDVEDTNSTEVPKDSGTKPKTKEELAVLKKLPITVELFYCKGGEPIALVSQQGGV